MPMMDVARMKRKCLKEKKISIVLIAVLGSLTLLNAVLFIVFANYQIETEMMIMGSISTSILALASLFVVFAYLLPSLSMARFLKEIETSKEEVLVASAASVGDKLVTARKGIVFFEIRINDSSFYCLDPEIVSRIQIGEETSFIVHECFIVGVKDE